MKDNLSKIICKLKFFSEADLGYWPKPKYYPGQKIHGIVPFSYDKMKVHIDHVLPSYYADWLIIYRVYGKHKQWWHEFMCKESDMDWYIEKAKR